MRNEQRLRIGKPLKIVFIFQVSTNRSIMSDFLSMDVSASWPGTRSRRTDHRDGGQGRHARSACCFRCFGKHQRELSHEPRVGFGECLSRSSYSGWETSSTLKRSTDRYVAAMSNQSATLDFRLRHHAVDARLTKSLLVSRGRTGSNHCRVVREYLR